MFADPEIRKTTLFSAFNFLAGLGFSCGFFSAHALLISRFGTSSLFYTYLGGALAALALSSLFYFLIDRFSRPKMFLGSFAALGILTLLAWFHLRGNPAGVVSYVVIRALFYAIYVVCEIEFWLAASDAFTNFQARRRFPILSAASIVGMILGGYLLELFADDFGATNFILVWGILLIASPFLLWEPLFTTPIDIRDQFHFDPLPEETQSLIVSQGAKPHSSSNLAILLFLFWLVYSFLCYGIDFLFNTIAHQQLVETSSLASYLGRVTIFGSFIVLFYQLFLAGPLTVRFGLDRTIILLPLLAFISVLFILIFPSLWIAGLAQGISYFFIDFTSVSLLSSALNVFPRRSRGRIKLLTEGIGRPSGTILLFLVSGAGLWILPISVIQGIILTVAFLFLVFPFLFQKNYIRYLLSCLSSQEPSVLSNAIQALGEKNKTMAVTPLRTLLKHTRRINLKKTIALSLGHIQSREAFKEIVQLFSLHNEGLQLTVMKSVSHFNNYEAMYALLRLMQSKYIVSFQVRVSGMLLLTRLIGRKMVPFLMQALEDPDARVRANAIESMGLLRDPKTIPILRPFLKDENHRIRANTIIALYRFPKLRDEAEKALVGLYRSPTPVSQYAAVFAIGQLKLKTYEKELIPLLNSKDMHLVLHAASALGQMGNNLFCEPFLNLLRRDNEELAEEAAHRMGQLPRASRYRLFEQIAKLSKKERALIFQRFDHTPLDFSFEKDLMERRKMLPSQLRL